MQLQTLAVVLGLDDHLDIVAPKGHRGLRGVFTCARVHHADVDAVPHLRIERPATRCRRVAPVHVSAAATATVGRHCRPHSARLLGAAGRVAQVALAQVELVHPRAEALHDQARPLGFARVGPVELRAYLHVAQHDAHEPLRLEWRAALQHPAQDATVVVGERVKTCVHLADRQRQRCSSAGDALAHQARDEVGEVAGAHRSTAVHVIGAVLVTGLPLDQPLASAEGGLQA